VDVVGSVVFDVSDVDRTGSRAYTSRPPSSSSVETGPKSADVTMICRTFSRIGVENATRRGPKEEALDGIVQRGLFPRSNQGYRRT